MSDELPDPLAQLDQMLAGLKDWGRLMRAHYVAMLEQGFNTEQAILLTAGYQQAIITVHGAHGQ